MLHDTNIEDLDEATVEEVTPMQIMNCPNCGVVPTYTGTCGYCGERCND